MEITTLHLWGPVWNLGYICFFKANFGTIFGRKDRHDIKTVDDIIGI